MYKKIFFTFGRFPENRSSSTNTRVKSILEYLGLSERRITGNEIFENLNDSKIDYSRVHEKLNEFRKISREYLRNCFTDIEKKVKYK